MAYKKDVQKRLDKLKKAKQLLEEAHGLLQDVKYDVYGNTCEVNCADEATMEAIRFTNTYISLVKKAKLWAFSNIYVPKETK